MEIELPDGTILDAPDDADPSAVAKAYLKNQSRQQLTASNPGEYDPNSPEWKAKYGATSGMSGMDKFWAGAGKSVADIGRGVKQLVGLGSREEFDEVKKRDAALMDTGAGSLGYVGGTLATTLLPVGIAGKGAQAAGMARTANAARSFVNPQTFTAAAGAGAVQGALQPVGTQDSRALNTLIGAASGTAGQAIAKGVGRIAVPVNKTLSRVDAKAVQTLKSAGVPLDAAQTTGSERLMQAKRFLADNPLTAAKQTKQAEATAAGFTRAALKEAGENADVADEAVLGRAFDRVGKVFDNVAANNPIKVDQKLLNELTKISQGASATLEQQQARLILGQVDEVIAKASGNGAIDGAAYQNIKQNLDILTNSNQPGVKQWAANLRGKLDEALQRSAKGGDYGALKTARKQYGALSKIVEAVNPDGNVSPAKLYNVTNVKAYGQKKAMATGIRQSELQKLAKAGKRIIPERMPNSGTTPRGMLQLALPGAIGAGYGYAKEGDMRGALMYGAGGALAPMAMQKMLNNPSAVNYLSNGLSGVPRQVLSAPQRAGLLTSQLPAVGLLELSQQQ